MSRVRAAQVVGALLAALVGGCIGPSAVSAQPTSNLSARATKPAEIRVATYNIQDAGKNGRDWEPRRADVLKQFRQMRADVVVVQEGKNFGRNLAKQPLAWLAKKTGYQLAPTQIEPSVDTDADGYVVFHDTPTIMYKPGRLQFEKNPYRITSLNGDYPPVTRKAHRAAFKDRRTGQRLMVVGLHLSVGQGASKDAQRVEELAEVDAELAWGRRHGLRVPATVWAGDYNSPNSRRSPVSRHLSRHGLVDSFTKAKQTTNPRLNTFNGLRRRAASSARRIDQIWVPRGTKVKRWDQIANVRDGRYRGRFASDHNPVVATIVLPRSS